MRGWWRMDGWVGGWMGGGDEGMDGQINDGWVDGG